MVRPQSTGAGLTAPHRRSNARVEHDAQSTSNQKGPAPAARFDCHRPVCRFERNPRLSARRRVVRPAPSDVIDWRDFRLCQRCPHLVAAPPANGTRTASSSTDLAPTVEPSRPRRLECRFPPWSPSRLQSLYRSRWRECDRIALDRLIGIDCSHASSTRHD